MHVDELIIVRTNIELNILSSINTMENQKDSTWDNVFVYMLKVIPKKTGRTFTIRYLRI